MGGSYIGDPHDCSVIIQACEVGIVFCVVADVQIQSYVLRVIGYNNDRRKRALPASVVLHRTGGSVVGFDVKEAIRACIAEGVIGCPGYNVAGTRPTIWWIRSGMNSLPS